LRAGGKTVCPYEVIMNYTTPEKKGISTDSIKRYLKLLEKNGLSTHSVIIARADDIVFEKYWAPFNKDKLHRLYSVTKSFVSIAIGFLEQEGVISLDDSISVYFPEESAKSSDENVRKQTIRDMLEMRTAFPKEKQTWFSLRTSDRVLSYFKEPDGALYPSGTLYSYDSTGSFILGALVERVSGMSLVEYLDKKLFSKLGITDVKCLKCPGGHSWGDSALLMKPTDFLKCAKFLLDGGRINGEQVLNEKYVKDATAMHAPTNSYGFGTLASYGYGFQIWRTHNNSFFLNGMGCQLAVCCPEKNMILVYNGDNQGCDIAKSIIIDGFFSLVYDEAEESELPEYLGEPIGEYKLFAIQGNSTSSLTEKINGKKFVAKENPMRIREFSLNFHDDGDGSFTYVNATGEKTLPFGINKNAFSIFPEDGYSHEVGSVKEPGHKYECATSAAWATDEYFRIRVQIIDEYFGNLGIEFAFKDDTCAVRMTKCAEDFLDEYSGLMTAELQND